MKIYFSALIVLIVVTLQGGLNAQSNFTCKVLEPEMAMERLISNRTFLDKYGITKSLAKTYVPIKFHLVGEDDGVGRVKISDVINDLCLLNEKFADLGLVFYIYEGFNEINNTIVYTDPRSGSATATMQSQRNSKGTKAMNVFVTQDAGAGAGGYYSGFQDWIVIEKQEFGGNAFAFAHEVGHFFSLAHPHIGWEDEPWNEAQYGKMVTIAQISSSQSGGVINVELVDRANCVESGDLVCDTPPDYNFGGLWPSNCPPFNIIVTDANGDTIKPLQNNYMSYFRGCESATFTAEQSDLIKTDINQNDRNYLRSSYIPDTSIITEVVSLLSPSFNQKIEFYNRADLLWTSVEGASEYFIQLTGAGKSTQYFVKDTTLTLTDLAPNTTYNWKVHPFNEVGGCATEKASLFKTSNLSTSVFETQIGSSFLLYPNPLGKNSKLNIEFNAPLTILGAIDVVDMLGRTVISNPVNIRAGVNLHEVDLGSVQAGIYLVTIASSEGKIAKKIIIE